MCCVHRALGVGPRPPNPIFHLPNPLTPASMTSALSCDDLAQTPPCPLPLPPIPHSRPGDTESNLLEVVESGFRVGVPTKLHAPHHHLRVHHRVAVFDILPGERYRGAGGAWGAGGRRRRGKRRRRADGRGRARQGFLRQLHALARTWGGREKRGKEWQLPQPGWQGAGGWREA